MSRFTLLCTAIAVAVATATAIAHDGPRVWIGSSDGRLTTFIGNNDTNPTVYTPRRVFVGGIDEDTLTATGQLDEYPVPGTGIFASEFPAYQVRLDGNAGFGTGRSFGFAIPGPLLAFNSATRGFQTTRSLFADWGPVPQMSESAGASLVATGDAPVPGFNFYSYNTPGDHAHLVSVLLGDGTNSVDGPHFVYAVPMRLATGGLGDSLTYYMILARGVPMTNPVFQDALQIGNFVLTATPGDANVDGKVDAADLGALASHWQTPANWAGGDFNFDGRVNISDLYLLATNWHFGAASLSTDLVSLGLPPVAMPEPSVPAVAGAVLGLSLILSRPARRRSVLTMDR